MSPAGSIYAQTDQSAAREASAESCSFDSRMSSSHEAVCDLSNPPLPRLCTLFSFLVLNNRGRTVCAGSAHAQADLFAAKEALAESRSSDGKAGLSYYS